MRSLRAIGIAMAGVMASLDLAMAAALGTQVGRSRGAWKGSMVMAQLAVVAFRHLEIPHANIILQLMISTPPFPEILVINLDHRSDRWTTIAERCARGGLQPNRVSAVVEKPGWKGCGRSHVRCVEIAKERGLPLVLIIEDDALFSPESIGRFRSLLPHLWQNRDKWERFSGGPNLPPRIIPKPVIRIMSQEHRLLYVRGLAAHFNLIHAGAYDAVLRWDPRIDRMIDVYFMALETHPPNDI